MTGSRYLLVAEDAGGTVPPMIALAQALIARGDDVLVLGQPCIEARAKAAGCRFEPYSTIGDYDRARDLEDQLEILGPLLAGPSPAEDLVRIAQRENTDMTVVDCTIAGALVAAESLRCPSAVLLHCMFRTFVDLWFGEYWPFFAEPVNDIRRSLSLDDVSSWTDLFSRQDVVLSPVPQVFDAPSEDRPDNLHHVGFLVPRVDDSEPPVVAVGSDPAVLVSLSTTAFPGQESLLRTIVVALGELPVRALVTAGEHIDAGDPTPNVSVRDYVPHAAVLPSVDVVVSHAGLGTVAAALSHGVPMVCAPMGRDQALNTQRVVALGAGIAIEPDASASDVAGALRTILEDASYAEAARTIARASADAGGAERAALLLTDLAG